MAKSFFDFFPTPKFLEMPAPGLALNDSGLKFIEFGSGEKGTIIKRYASTPLPKGLIEAGAIVDQEALIKALANFRKSWSLKYIRTSLPEERAYLFQTTVPRVSEKELRTVVESSIEENVPLSVSEVIFDYSVLPEIGEEPKDQLKVSVSVIPEVLVMEYLAVFREAGFIPLHFDVESQAVAKSVVSPNDPTVSLVINLNKTKAGLYIVANGAVYFTSTIPVQSIDDSGEHVSSPTLASSEEIDSTILAKYPGLKTLVAEVQKVFLYWQAQADKENRRVVPIETIVLCGEEAARAGIAEYLSRTLKTKTVLANVWQNAFSLDDYIPAIPLAESLSYAGAVGLALSRKEEA